MSACSCCLPRPQARQSDHHDVRIHRHDGDSSSPKTFVLSYRARKKLHPVPTAIIDKSALFRAGLVHILAGSHFRVTAECPALGDLPEEVLGNTQCVALIGLDKDAEAALPRSHR